LTRRLGVAAVLAIAAGVAVTLPAAFSAPSIAGQEETVRKLEAEIAGLDSRFSQADTAYRASQAKVDELTGRITANTAALKKAEADFIDAQGTLADRLSMIYRRPAPSQVELLLRSGSISEVGANVDYMKRVQDQDRIMILRIRAAKAAMAQKRKELIADRKDEVVHRAAAKKQLAEVGAIRSQRRGVLISARNQLTSMIAIEVKRKNAARVAALRRAQAQVNEGIANGGGNSGGGNSGGGNTGGGNTGGNTGGGGNSGGGGTPAGDIAAKLRQIALCESGGNPTAVSPSGLYRGKYQFDPQTWAAMGGAGTDPAKASEAEQDRVAYLLYQQRGAAPWPVCGR
jgi:peptidoglycan hydrolase CwlO-like protein